VNWIVTTLSVSLALLLVVTTVTTASGAHWNKYVIEKTYKLFGDGYIYGNAKITCWRYSEGNENVYVKINLLKVYNAKGSVVTSAYIIDVEKNGSDSYLQIGEPESPTQYNYVRFSQKFAGKDFPTTTGKPCPVDSMGRIVVVVGTKPPVDSDTLSSGSVDIIASTTKGTAQKGSL